MKHWVKRLRGALGMGLIWGLAWGFVGGLMEVVDPRGRIVDIWPIVLAIPGFIGGVVFAIVLTSAEGRRPFDELSIRRFGFWGAMTGALLGLIPFLLVGLNPVITLPLAVLGALSASGTLAIARKADDRARLAAGQHEAINGHD